MSLTGTGWSHCEGDHFKIRPGFKTICLHQTINTKREICSGSLFRGIGSLFRGINEAEKKYVSGPYVYVLAFINTKKVKKKTKQKNNLFTSVR